jgi:protein phosphatase 1L
MSTALIAMEPQMTRAEKLAKIKADAEKRKAAAAAGTSSSAPTLEQQAAPAAPVAASSSTSETPPPKPARRPKPTATSTAPRTLTSEELIEKQRDEQRRVNLTPTLLRELPNIQLSGSSSSSSSAPTLTPAIQPQADKRKALLDEIALKRGQITFQEKSEKSNRTDAANQHGDLAEGFLRAAEKAAKNVVKLQEELRNLEADLAALDNSNPSDLAAEKAKRANATTRRINATAGFADDPNPSSRETMEDAHRIEIDNAKNIAFFGVFDGHGGSAVAHFAAANLYENSKLQGLKDEDAIIAALKSGFSTTQEQLTPENLQKLIDENEAKAAKGEEKIFERAMPSAKHQGCTAIVAYKLNNRLYVANAGDARAVLCGPDNTAVDLSRDHKPDRPDEKERIEKLGGSVTESYPARVNGILAVARALGDKALNPYVTSMPDITATILTADNPFLILACDGIWDVFTSQEAVNLVAEELVKKPNDYNNAARALVQGALHKGTTDNVTAIVVGFDM